MSGDNRNDDQEFSDDFILEDAPPADAEPAPPPPPSSDPSDLTRLFDEQADGASAGPPPAALPPGSAPPASPAGDADDLLFVDHTVAAASEQFAGRTEFHEASGAQWKGKHMAPDEIGIPVDAADEEAAAASEQSFTSQLDSLLEEDGFAVDAEQDLQLVEDDSDLDAAQPRLAAETFILDEGDGQWREPATAAEPVAEFAPEEGAEAGSGTTVASTAASNPLDDGFAGDGDGIEGDQQPARDEAAVVDEVADAAADDALAGGDQGVVEDGWEPLPDAAEQFATEMAGAATTADADAATAPTDAAPALVGASASDDDRSIYVDEQQLRVVGGSAPGRGTWLRVLTSMAAAVLLLGAGAAVVLRPEWFGLHVQPDLVARVTVARPDVDVKVAPPAMPREPVATSPTPSTPGGVAPQPQPTDLAPPAEPPPVTTTDEPPTGAQPGVSPSEPTPGGTDEPSTAPSEPAVGELHPPPVGQGDQPPPAVPDPGIAVPTPPDPAVATTIPVANAEAIPAPAPDSLLPAGKDLLIGEPTEAPHAGHEAPPGVSAGGRAFAQLRNGNYFIGSVKAVGRDAITMRMDGGEVTLAMSDLTRVTALDSTEFQALKESTSGFLRLSNKNRLVGTILKDLADDHYVLEMKSNRLMVPKTQIEAVEGASTGEVVVAGGKDDEAWLREVAARMLQESATGRRPD